jgi:putative ATP-dependent endonuclease of OLD family
LEALGVCTIDAGGFTSIPDLADLYRGIDKCVFALCDKLVDEKKALIEAKVKALFMHEEKGFEDLVLKNTTDEALKRFAKLIEWPEHILQKYPDLEAQPQDALKDYFCGKKADWGIADFLAQCSEPEIPQWIRDACTSLKQICEPPPAGEADAGEAGAPVAVAVELAAGPYAAN